MLAVIRVGGKQYLVSPGKKIKLEKLDKEEGSDISFSDVLLFQDDKNLEIGSPVVKGVKVLGKIAKQGRTKKIIVLKYH
ncbi:MAG: 50S ribosomal protein L21, partial [Candidatus Parcubacteria bacterium]|nr:50S ribosomal protein L21 [Candidatus Parcubacteria bacterium]